MYNSKGEQLIYKILNKEKIKFQREKTFYDLKKGKYRFDFYLPDYNICIEYDGEQHFKYTSFFHKNKDDLKKQKERDRRKNSYCLANNIKLYRIPYYKTEKIKNFSNILDEDFLVKTKWHNDIIKGG